VAWNFEELPEDERNKLILELSKKDRAAKTVKKIIRNNFDKLPDEIRDLGKSL
jgi:hypothetical protein